MKIKSILHNALLLALINCFIVLILLVPGCSTETTYTEEIAKDNKIIAKDSEAIELNPNNAFAYSQRGDKKLMTHDYDGAIADLTKAVELDPNDYIAYVNRGSAYRFKGDLDAAIADETRAIELNPNKAGAYVFRGMIRKQKGDSAGALEDFKKAHELDPAHFTY
jgi:tetratricopeptide (TPR) repeat protein